MKISYLALLIIILVGCTTTQIEEGLVNFPDTTDQDLIIPIDDIPKIPDTNNTSAQTTTTRVVSTVATTTRATTTTMSNDGVTTINVVEGDLLTLNLKATDPDNNPIKYSFSSPLDNNGEWQTESGDAGVYNVLVTASDGKLSTTKQIKIIVTSNNKAPQIMNLDQIRNIVVTEGELITLKPNVIDADGDAVNVAYSGYMTSDKYQTGFNDAGKYKVLITLDDGKTKTSEEIQITVLNKNRPPILSGVSDKSITEGDSIDIDAITSDPDGDKVTITYSYPLDMDGKWTTKVGDAGLYKTKITASDGENEVTKEIQIVVATANSPPTLEPIDDIIVKEGETVIINPIASDIDGDKIVLTYSGWMKTNTYKTNYDDAGTHTVTVTADDGKAKTTVDVKIIVVDENRAPENLEIEVIVTPGK